MTKLTLKDLAVDHDYYAHDSNYYDNDDIDMNLVYRFDLKQRKNKLSYELKLYFILQRKGIYAPCLIDKVTEEDVPQIVEFLNKHFDKLQRIWAPISKPLTE